MRTARRYALLLLACAVGIAAAEPDAPGPVYLRVNRPSPKVVQLDIAMRRFVPPGGSNGTVVWLVGVAHVADTNYYARIQKHLDAQQLVLFEGVGGDETAMETNGQHSLQGGLAKSLGLAFQLDAIDYDRKHFRNSDMPIEQIQQALMGNAAGVAAVAPGDVPAGGDEPETNPELDQLLELMSGTSAMAPMIDGLFGMLSTSPKMRAMVKLVLIETMGSMGNDLLSVAGLDPRLGELLTVLIQDRNRIVIRDLKRALAADTPPASVAVFYGAGHMQHLEKALAGEMGYRAVETIWLPAFGVDMDATGVTRQEVDMIKTMLQLQENVMKMRLQPRVPSAAGVDDDEDILPGLE